MLPQLGGNYTLEELEREHIQRVVARTATSEEAARSLGRAASGAQRGERDVDPVAAEETLR